MRNRLLAIGLIVLSVSTLSAQTKPVPPTSEQVILQLTRDWLAAEERHDRPTLQRIIADDFEGTAPMGNTVFKEDVLPIEGSQRGLAITTSDMKARLFDDTAIVTAHGAQKSAEKRQVRFTVVFVKRDNEWKMVAGHLSAVPE